MKGQAKRHLVALDPTREANIVAAEDTIGIVYLTHAFERPDSQTISSLLSI